MITHVKFVGIPTRDQAAALVFWTEKIGFTVTTDHPMGAQRWIELATPDGETGVALFTPDGQADRIGTFFNGAFTCADVEATYRELVGRGVTFTEPPTRQPWGSYAKFQDPDGNIFVLSSR